MCIRDRQGTDEKNGEGNKNGMKDYMELDSTAQDMLKELGNIGTGNAITALSAMLGKELVMECPQVRVVGFNEVPDTLGGMEAIRVGVLVQTGGDISGIFMFLISESFTQDEYKRQVILHWI